MIRWLRNLIVYGYYGGAGGRLINGRNQEALAWIDKAIAWDPEGERNYLLQACRGECLMRLKRYEEAIVVLRMVLQIIEAESHDGDPPFNVYVRVDNHLQYSEAQYNKSLNRTPEPTTGFSDGSGGAG